MSLRGDYILSFNLFYFFPFFHVKRMTSIEYKKTFGNRQRSSSFNHSVTNKKYSTRRPSYDILSTKKSIQFLNIEQPTAYSASSIDESNSDLEEDEDDDTQNITDYYLYRDEEEGKLRFIKQERH